MDKDSDPGKKVGCFFILSLACILVKFSVGSDDLVWLSPFMNKARFRKKIDYGIKYVMSVSFLCCVACVIALGIKLATHAGSTASSGSNNTEVIIDRAIATVAAFLLVCYSIYMADDEGYFDRCKRKDEGIGGYGAVATSADDLLSAKERKSVNEDGAESDGDDDEEHGWFATQIEAVLMYFMDGVNNMADRIALCCCGMNSDSSSDVDPEVLEMEAKKSKSIVIVAFLGSMDDFMVYFTLALSGTFGYLPLIIGTILGAILIALFVGTALEYSERLANCIAYIPVPLVLIFLAVFVVVDAWTTLFDFLTPTMT